MADLRAVKTSERMGRNEAGKLFSSSRQFGRLVERGLIEKGDDGKFDREEVVRLASTHGDVEEAKAIAEVEYTSEITRGLRQARDHSATMQAQFLAAMQALCEAHLKLNERLLERVTQQETREMSILQSMLDLGQQRADAESQRIQSEASARLRERVANRALDCVPSIMAHLGGNSELVALAEVVRDMDPRDRMVLSALPGMMHSPPEQKKKLTMALKALGVETEAEVMGEEPASVAAQ